MTRPEPFPLSLLRIQIHDTPYDGGCLSLEQDETRNGTSSDRSRTLYIAFPDGTPHIYVSMGAQPKNAAKEKSRGLKDIVMDVSSNNDNHLSLRDATASILHF